MTSMYLFIFIVCIIAILFLVINFLFAPHNANEEKDSPFECGFHSFFHTRIPFPVLFMLFGVLFLIFDLEIFLMFPFAVSEYVNSFYGLIITLSIMFIISIG